MIFNTISYCGTSCQRSSVTDPLHHECAREIPYDDLESQEQPIGLGTTLSDLLSKSWAGSPTDHDLEWKTQWKCIGDMPDYIRPPENTRNNKQDHCENNLQNGGFEHTLHEFFKGASDDGNWRDYTRNRIATPAMARKVPANACQPIFSLYTK